ncbi:MAG: hypothetical protein JWN60_3015 [Acidobacteria bacterium]|jgi:hypothetical protein|nr:hypothetical protein [Acidobacteriota bacterium]
MKIKLPRARKNHFTGVVLIFLFLAMFSVKARAQETVDKIVATVSDGVRTELITHSDLVWQLALQPNAPVAPPRSEDLNRALELVINQRLFALEAQRLPRFAPTQAEIDEKIKDVLAVFPSNAEFERRLKLVGFDSVKDSNFERIMGQRVAIDKYLEFRFRSFAVITPEDEAKYYRETYVPEFRRKYPGLLMPSLDEKREEIRQILIEEKVASSIEEFLDEAKRRGEIIILSQV